MAFSQIQKGKDYLLTDGNRRKTILLPTSHFYIGAEENLGLYSVLLEFNKSSTTIVQRGFNIDIFTERIPFVVGKNFFTPLFTQGMFRVVESGLWDLWNEFEIAESKLNQVKEYIFLLKYKRDVDWRSIDDIAWVKDTRCNIVALIWKYQKVSWVRAEPLDTQVLMVVFSGFLLGLSIASCILFLEFCSSLKNPRNGNSTV
ncbi:unnamed protein product [Allacma fusca]|uniref:Uncharacterized protein n=1 Tax=Allacma fusca TaxID=39272 RepID=A0A8J2K5R9_9HEXA|nr:unnamed protein product [Allacma fusca]